MRDPRATLHRPVETDGEHEVWLQIRWLGLDPQVFAWDTIRWWLAHGKTPEQVVAEILLPERRRP